MPSVADAHEVVHNFRIVSQTGDEEEAESGAAVAASQELQPPRLKKRFDWFKRNYNPYGSNLYSKIPVIRTGK